MAGGRLSRTTLWRATQIVVGVAVVALAVGAVAGNWAAFRAQPLDWHIRWLPLLGSVAIVWACYALLIEAWRRVVCSLDAELRFLPAARIWTVASLGKYVPGKLWAVAGAAVMATRAGVAAGTAVMAAVILQVLAVLSGVIMVAALGPGRLRAAGPGVDLAILLAGAAAIAGVVALAWPPAVQWGSRLLPSRFRGLRPIPPGALALALAANLVAWAGYGLAFVLLAHGLLDQIPLDWRTATLVFTSSYLVGLVALFAPAGLGPREGLLVLLLTGPLGPKVALALAVATRLQLTCTELGAALPFLLIRRLGRLAAAPASTDHVQPEGSRAGS